MKIRNVIILATCTIFMSPSVYASKGIIQFIGNIRTPGCTTSQNVLKQEHPLSLICWREGHHFSTPIITTKSGVGLVDDSFIHYVKQTWISEHASQLLISYN